MSASASTDRTTRTSRRRIVFSVPLVASMAVSSAASACAVGGGTTGTAGTAGTAPEAAARSKAPVKLRFSSWGTRQWGHEQIIESFKAKHPHVTEVQIEDGGPFLDYRIKLLNQIAGDDLADVPTVGGQWYLEIVSTGALLKLDSYIRAEQRRRQDFYLPNVPAAIMEKGTLQGALSGLPYLADLAILYVNEHLFRERGQPLPPSDWADARWTWDAALERAKALTDPAAPSGATFGFSVNDALLCDWASVVYQRGGDVLTPDRRGYALDRPEAHEPLQWRADLRLRHRVVPTAEEVRGGAAFDTGRTAMTIGWSSAAQTRQGQNPPARKGRACSTR
jgi:ABC-type glycerol-3-phosphate transport system substrate-binding protein